MKITKVVLRNKEKEDSRMKAIATVTLDEAFVITGIRLIQGDDKMFIAMPSRKVSEGVYDDIAHPVNQETRQMFEDAIFKAIISEEELADAKAKIEVLTDELKILLLPKDPNDERNVIVEIRGGAGGEEAALFAASFIHFFCYF